MANWDILKEAISSTIKTNGNQEITGQLLQNVLLNIVSNFGENISYRGIATPTTNPGAPDGPVFYFAFEPGRYANFGGILVADKPLILTWNNGSWTSEPMDFASIESVNGITESINRITESVNGITESVNEITKRVARIKGTISASDNLDSKKEISDIGLWFVNRTQDPGIVLVCRDFENHYVQVKLSATRNVSINETTNKPSIQYRKYIDNAWTEWTEIEFNILKTHILQADGVAIQGTPLDDYIKAIANTEKIATDKIYDNKQNKYQDKINDIVFNGQSRYNYIDNISLIDLSNVAIILDHYITTSGNLVAFNGRNVSDYIDVSNYSGKILVFWLANYFKDAGCTLCFYNTNKELLYTDRNYPKGPITLSTDGNKLSFVLLSGISYIRISFSKGNSIRLSVYDKNETSQLNDLASLTKKGEVVDILCNISYKRLFYDDITKSGGPFSSFNFYIHLNKGIYVRKIISYTELTDKFKIVRWDETLNNIITVYSTTLTLDSKDSDKYIYSLSDGGYFVNTDDCYFIPKNSSEVFKLASSGEKNKVALYSNIEKGNERIFGNILLSYDLLFLSPNEEDEKVEQEVDTIKVSGRFFRGKNYVAFGDSITDPGTGAEEVGLAYPNLIGKYFGFTTINLGTSGSTPHDHGTHMNLSNSNLARITSDTMLVTISGGTNGWVTSDDINTLDRDTSIGAFNYAIDYIRRVAPKCVIILCPMYARSENFIKDYERIAENKGVGLAPILNNNLINWRDDVKDSSSPLYHLLLRDGVHPTNYGAFRMAALIKEYARYFII